MHSDNSQQEDAQYGAWTWIAGFVIAFVIMAVMFGLATGSR